jgi:two-component system sensor histidine kinase DegS
MAEQETISIADFLEEVHARNEQAKRELKEIDVLIKQSEAEVERLAQRNAQITTYVSQIRLDTAPREDIKEGYENMLNTQQRLFTMRGQLEKLQSDRRNLERLIAVQSDLLEVTTGLGPVTATASNRAAASRQSTVVRVIQTEESARQSLVRKMHDGPASSLSNFILQAEICERLFDSDPDQARTELYSLKSAAASTFGKVKDFIFDLRPMMLDDLGVIPTLRSYINSFEDKSGIPVSLGVTGIERRVPDHIEVTIFRAVQELLNNARSHGRATQISAQIDMGSEQILISVEDNGTGFNPAEYLQDDSASRRTIGLHTLKERVEMLGGELTVESSIGNGTKSGILHSYC